MTDPLFAEDYLFSDDKFDNPSISTSIQYGSYRMEWVKCQNMLVYVAGKVRILYHKMLSYQKKSKNY